MKLFDKDEKYIGSLKDVLVANHTEEINGEDVLELTTLDNRVKKGYRVVYRDVYGYWKEFIIKGIEEEKKEDGIVNHVFCESSLYETLGDYIEDKRPSGQASTALLSALEGTRWEVGIVDNLGSSQTNFYHMSAKKAIHKVAQAWQGEIRTRIEISGNKIANRYVDLLTRRGYDLGKRFTYTKDIIEISKITHREDVITALYGYGKGTVLDDGGYGRRIDFADINQGKAYVENNEARLVWGRNNPDGSKSHVFGKVEFDNVEDKEELLQLTTNELEELSKVLITYEANVIDLKAYGLEHEGAELGDTVAVIDKDFEPELRLKARVIGINRDVLNPENNNIILGNFIPSFVDSAIEDRRFINNFRGKQGVWDRSKIINSDDTINAQHLNNLVDELNAKMNAQGGYVYISEDGKGITTYDKPLDQNPTMAIQILGGSFRIANSRLPNGEWEWRTFGDGNGFVADLIVAGMLQGGKVKFDLTNGTLLIGNSMEDYNLLFDGESLKINLSNGMSIEETINIMEGEISQTIEKVENLVVDAANRLYQSQTQIQFDFNIGAGTIQLLRNSMHPYYKVTSSTNIDLSASFPKSQYAENLEGETVTISIDIMTDEDKIIILDGKEHEIKSGKWTRVWVTKEFPNNTTRNIRARNPFSRKITRDKTDGSNLINSLSADVNVIYYRNLQVQRGPIMSNWTLTPEELESSINRYATQIKQLTDEITLSVEKLEGGINSNSSKLSLLDDEIKLNVKKNELSTEIIQNAESIVTAINSTDGVGRVKTTKVTVDEQGLTVDDGAIIIRDSNNTAIVTSDGLRVMYVFTSSGELNGWQKSGIWGNGPSIEKHQSTLNVYIPSDLKIETAQLYTRSMPTYRTGWGDAPDGYYHPRNLRLYKGNTAHDGFLEWPADSSYAVLFGQYGRTNITSNVWGSSTWTPTGQGIKEVIGNVTTHLTAGENHSFMVDTTDSVTQANSRYMGAMQLELVVTGFLRG